MVERWDVRGVGCCRAVNDAASSRLNFSFRKIPVDHFPKLWCDVDFDCQRSTCTTFSRGCSATYTV